MNLHVGPREHFRGLTESKVLLSCRFQEYRILSSATVQEGTAGLDRWLNTVAVVVVVVAGEW